MQIDNSERLTYGFATEADIEDLFQLDQDPEVMRYINGGKTPTMHDMHNVYLPRLASYADQDKGWGLWKINLTHGDEFIGWILVRPLHFFGNERNDDNLELGWRLARKHWGQGYATEGATAVMLALEAAGCKHFSALAMEDNTASTNVMVKLGMEYVKTDVCQDPLGDEVVVYYERIV